MEKGEQGVLIYEPYKSEIGPYWRFKAVDIARKSAEKIFTMFKEYLTNDYFVGADMTRKYLQMGYTRAGGTSIIKEVKNRIRKTATKSWNGGPEIRKGSLFRCLFGHIERRLSRQPVCHDESAVEKRKG